MTQGYQPYSVAVTVPGIQGGTGGTGPAGPAGQQTAALVQSTALVLGRAVQLDPAQTGKVRSVVNAVTRLFAGISTATQASGTQQTYTQGPIPKSLVDLGAGLATAVGVDASGVPVRVTDPTCVSGLNYLGHCDETGAMVLAPRIAHRYEWNDYGLVPDWDGTTGTDNLPMIVGMLAAMKRDAILAGSLNKIQTCHFDGYFYVSDTIHVQQGVVWLGTGRSNPWLYNGYHWSPGTQFIFPDHCDKFRIHGGADFAELGPAVGATEIPIASVANVLNTDVVITTTTPHGLTTGDTVRVGIVSALTAGGLAGRNVLPGNWTVLVTGASSFKLRQPGHEETIIQGNGEIVTGNAIVKCTVPWVGPGGDGGYPSAGYSQFRSFTVYGRTSSQVCGDAFRCTTPVILEGIQVEQVGGDGLAFIGDHTANGGNANGWRIDNCAISGCGGHGLRAEGGDANVGSATHVDVSLTRGHGVYDTGNLGNKYDSVQCAGCGAPSGETGPFCDFYLAGVTSPTVATACYSEAGISIIMAPAMVQGGNLSGSSRTDDRSTGSVQNGQAFLRGAPAHYGYSTGDLLISQLGSNDGTGTFASWARGDTGARVDWILNAAQGVVYSQRSGSSSARAIGIPIDGNAIRAGLGIHADAPIFQSGYYMGEVGQDPQFHDFGPAAPTTLNRRIGDTRKNTTPTELGPGGSKYVIDRWVCIANATETSPGVYDGGTWLECRNPTGN